LRCFAGATELGDLLRAATIYLNIWLVALAGSAVKFWRMVML
jgi:hypothetical protein